MSNLPHQEVTVRTATTSYPVLLGEGLLAQVGKLITERTSLRGTCALLTDTNVGDLYGATVEKSLTEAGFRVVLCSVPAGESSKSLAEAERCADAMIAAGLDRKAFVVALGGGVVGDLAGFVAAIYYRGIPFVQIPTTIVAQVDSAVGGKTGVNTRGGKNLIGSFHQPRLVIADARALLTLPEREFCEGFAEVVKHAIIRDAEMLDRIQPGNRENLTSLLAENVAIKAAIVEADEKEEIDLRALLNFGHTVGHAIENAAGYGEWFHGEAISLGMVVALRLSRHFAKLSQEEEQKVIHLLQALHLPVDFSKAPPTAAILSAMKTDKKFDSGKVRFVLTAKLGTAFVSSSITLSQIESVILELRGF